MTWLRRWARAVGTVLYVAGVVVACCWLAAMVLALAGSDRLLLALVRLLGIRV